MSELRYNPLLDDYTMVAGSRNKRPDMPKDYCAFCPGSGKVPDDYDVYLYPNDFPILSVEAEEPKLDVKGPYHTAKSFGKCDVVLYSKEHQGKLWELDDDHLAKLVKLWIDRFKELKELKEVKYVFPFENRGKEVGVTQPHPHGQIYAYPFLPAMVKEEMKNAKRYFSENKRNLYSDMIEEERRTGERLVYENDSFIVFIPFFAQYPYGVYIIAKDDIRCFEDFTEKEIRNFADALKTVVGSYDLLFDKLFPYMMGIYNAPVNTEEYEDTSFFRFNVKFFPPLRGKESIKYNASSETAAGAYGNPVVAETAASKLREVVEKFNESKNRF